MVTTVTVLTVKDAMVNLKRRESLSDRQMAERLGCSRSYWTLIRLGQRDFPTAMAVRAAGIWPELTRHLLDMAHDSVRPVADRPSQTAQDAA